ncbi:MAG: hypothetical protein R3237_04475 [Nitrosopumilaceae archaeon]|nr:hypothetical protein [Nitrosopumilaceae archaeon]
MVDEDITCEICYSKIVVYFHAKYDGNRGKCPVCGVEFPLE